MKKGLVRVKIAEMMLDDRRCEMFKVGDKYDLIAAYFDGSMR